MKKILNELVADDLITPLLEKGNDLANIGTDVLSVTWLDIILKFALPVAGILISYRIMKIIFIKIFSKSRLSSIRQAVAVKWSRIILRFCVVGGIVLLAYFIMREDFDEWGKRLLALFKLEFSIGGEDGAKITIVSLLLLFPAFYLSSFAGKSVRKILDSSFLGKLGIDESKSSSVGNIIRYVVMIIVFLFCLNTFIGINLSALSGLLVTLGIGLGFGLQNVVGNFFSGIAILFSRPVKERDRILVDGYEGEVVQIRLLSTVVKTLQNEDIIVPNSLITNSSVYNYTYNDRRILIKNSIGVSYDADVELALETLKKIAKDNPSVDRRIAPKVRLENFKESAIELVLVCWISDVSKRYDALSWNNLEIWRRFKVLGIELPYPQLVVHTPHKSRKNKEEEIEHN